MPRLFLEEEVRAIDTSSGEKVISSYRVFGLPLGDGCHITLRSDQKWAIRWDKEPLALSDPYDTPHTALDVVEQQAVSKGLLPPL